jgi:1D-myo-inositol-tetrakisphosphate 5-kinase/inositol-polyphosphate multikinase
LIREAYSALELRMVGGSLLIIYDVDWAHAQEGIKRYKEVNTEMKEVWDRVKDDEKGVKSHDEEDEDEDDCRSW